MSICWCVRWVSKVCLWCCLGLSVLRISIFVEIVLLIIDGVAFLHVIGVWSISWGLIIRLANLILAQVMWVITLRPQFWWTFKVMRNWHSLMLRWISIWNWWLLFHFIVAAIFTVFLVTLRYWLIWIIWNIRFIGCVFDMSLSFSYTILAVKLFPHLAIWSIRHLISILFMAGLNSCTAGLY